jgi:glutathione S-transferase
MDPKTRDEKLVGENVTDFKSRLDQLEKMLAGGGFACGADFTLADCALAPTMFFVTNLMPAFGVMPLDGHPKLAAWWTHVQSRPSVKKGLGEMGEALTVMQRGGGIH